LRLCAVGELTNKSAAELRPPEQKLIKELTDAQHLFVPDNAKPHVSVAQLRYSHYVNEAKDRIIFVVPMLCKAKNIYRIKYYKRKVFLVLDRDAEFDS